MFLCRNKKKITSQNYHQILLFIKSSVGRTYWLWKYLMGRSKPKSYHRACAKCTFSDSSRACVKSHPGIFSPLIRSIVSNDSVSDSEGPDHIARMRRLIWAFTVRICPNTRFRMTQPKSLLVVCGQVNRQIHLSEEVFVLSKKVTRSFLTCSQLH